MIVTLWKNIRESYYDAVRTWASNDTETAIFLLRLAIRRTEILIIALEKENGHGKDSNH